MDDNADLIELEDYIVSKRPSIKESDKIRLWVRSGGRCAICNKYLLDLEYDVSIGEMAHIVGWSKAKKSPRGDSDLALEDRNVVDNLVLLCADHHKIVDTKSLLEEFTIERLIKHKTDHELRIHHLTSLQVDSESIVIRMLGGIRGASVEVSKEYARHVIFHSQQKYARFLDSFDKHGIEIDLNALPDPESAWDSYWSIGQGIIDKSLTQLIQGVNNGEVRHLSVFALSRIPLLVYLGYKLDDKIPTSVYQKHRVETETWLWSATAPAEDFEVRCLSKHDSCDVSLILSLSGTIDIADLPKTVTEKSAVYEIRPVGTTPNRNIFLNRKSAENFSQTYHKFLSQLEIDHRNCKDIHLFPAIPIAAAIACGRGLMRGAQPAILIYDLTGSSYKQTIKINTNETN
jgi:hypothetical protein